MRRRDRDEFDDESFELPAWDVEQARPSTRSNVDRSGRDAVHRPDREPTERRAPKNPLPTLGDAFQRPTQRSPDPAPRPPATRDRSTSQRPGRPPARSARDIDYEQDFAHEAGFADAYLDDDGYESPYPERERSPRRRGQSTRMAASPARQPATRQIGGMLAAANPQTRLTAAVGGFVVISLVLMAATLLGRLSSLSDWIPIHLNAEGEPDRWGTNETLWRVPLMAFVFTVMIGVVAWYLRARDSFGSRFLVMSAVLIHVTSWIAVVNFVW